VVRIIMNTIQIFHSDTGTWEHSDTDTGGTLTPLTWGAGDAAACAMNGLVYVSGGLTGDSTAPTSAEMRIYDPTSDSWSSGAPLPEDRFDHVMVCDAAHNKLYVVTGYMPYDTEGTSYPSDTFWAYDATADTWDTSLAQHPAERGRHNADMIDADTILVAGGYFDGYLSKITHTYDISTNTWAETAGRLPWERLYSGSGVLPGGRMCLFGGSSFADWPATLLEDTFDCYSDGYWIPQVATMFEARTYVAGATLGDHIYAIGGVDTDTLGWPPTTYDQTALIERYPSGVLPDPGPDTSTDTVMDTSDDTPGDIPVIDVPTDSTSDTSTDVSVDVPTDNGGGDKGCGCSIVR
jgi:hypothetical protein